MQVEKQELTILFCDLLGSTEMAEDLSLDHFLEVMQSYHQCLYQCITMHYGYVAQHLGDGIMAYFGYPVKFDSAPVNAVKAGFSLLEQVPVLVRDNLQKFGIDLSIRISIHTGTVVMVDLGIGDRKERLALGGPPNISARLQNLAPVNGIVVSEATYLLTKEQFEYHSLGMHSIKGVSEQMHCYRPLLLKA
ncbi:MAG: adenylate/guanylate cyclase domain-containing protein [Saprospiraceae bacterium]|nr:adenylate/guanylate cyclase domain-containing protein [Saprospiraceae bacterium]